MTSLQESRNKSHHKIAISSIKETRFIQVSEIIRCESENSYTCFFLKNGEKITSSVLISEYEELLADYGFIRSHQSHLINKSFVKSLRKDEGIFC